MENKPILDPMCGSRMFYRDANDPRVQFNDNRTLETNLCDGRSLVVAPDKIVDVREMPYKDEAFYLVVFDPPHLTHLGDTSWMIQKYGKLPNDWRTFLSDAFDECWRVLAKNGTMVFKWNETDIPCSEVLKCFSQKPLLLNKRPKQSKTHWMVFFKSVE